LFYGSNDSMVLRRGLFYGSSLQKLMPTTFIDTITKNQILKNMDLCYQIKSFVYADVEKNF